MSSVERRLTVVAALPVCGNRIDRHSRDRSGRGCRAGTDFSVLASDRSLYRRAAWTAPLSRRCHLSQGRQFAGSNGLRLSRWADLCCLHVSGFESAAKAGE